MAKTDVAALDHHKTRAWTDWWIQNLSDERLNQMKTIWKYKLEVIDKQTISIPTFGEILCVMVQDDKPCIWVSVNPQNDFEQRTFIIKGTGHNIIEYNIKYIGSFLLMSGTFVGHLFEEKIQ